MSVVIWLWYLRLLKNKESESDEMGFGTLLWMMYLVVGGILVGHGSTVGVLPFVPCLLGWIICQFIVLRWSIKFNKSLNKHSYGMDENGVS